MAGVGNGPLPEPAQSPYWSVKPSMKTRMKEYRAKRGLTQERLAEMVGVRRETILYLENGKYNPSLRLAWAVARVLGASLEDLFEFEESELLPASRQEGRE